MYAIRSYYATLGGVAIAEVLRRAGLPLYQLLGGRSRKGVMVYGHANGRDIEESYNFV